MLKRIGLLAVALGTLAAAPAQAKGWIFSGGIGLTLSPDTFLITPQLEYQHDARLTYGPLVQVGVASGTFVTMGGSLRYLLGNHARFKPAVEGGLGLVAGSQASFGGSSVGVHIMFGMGFDYKIDNQISLGTMIRGNFGPPWKTFFLSWPLAMFRMNI